MVEGPIALLAFIGFLAIIILLGVAVASYIDLIETVNSTNKRLIHMEAALEELIDDEEEEPKA